jgi:hypothetical protein
VLALAEMPLGEGLLSRNAIAPSLARGIGAMTWALPIDIERLAVHRESRYRHESGRTERVKAWRAEIARALVLGWSSDANLAAKQSISQAPTGPDTKQKCRRAGCRRTSPSGGRQSGHP